MFASMVNSVFCYKNYWTKVVRMLEMINLMIKGPLYSNIIMSIKFAKCFKHQHQSHSHLTFSPFYIVQQDSLQRMPNLTYQQKGREGQIQNKYWQGTQGDDPMVKQKTMGFFDFPTNISEFEDDHEELLFSEPSSFSCLPSLEEDPRSSREPLKEL